MDQDVDRSDDELGPSDSTSMRPTRWNGPDRVASAQLLAAAADEGDVIGPHPGPVTAPPGPGRTAGCAALTAMEG